MIEGHIVSDWIDELERVCQRHHAIGRGVMLDFANVVFVDEKGLAALRRLLSLDVGIVNCPPLIESLLHDIQDD